MLAFLQGGSIVEQSPHFTLPVTLVVTLAKVWDIYCIQNGLLKLLQRRLVDFLFDHCFELCRCILIRRVTHSQFLHHMYEDEIGVTEAAFDLLRVEVDRQLEWFRLWEDIDEDLSRTME